MCGVIISQKQSELTKEWTRIVSAAVIFILSTRRPRFICYGRIPVSYSFNIVPLLLSDDVEMIYSILFAIKHCCIWNISQR
jgi:hypothetical protein